MLDGTQITDSSNPDISQMPLWRSETEKSGLISRSWQRSHRGPRQSLIPIDDNPKVILYVCKDGKISMGGRPQHESQHCDSAMLKNTHCRVHTGAIQFPDPSRISPCTTLAEPATIPRASDKPSYIGLSSSKVDRGEINDLQDSHHLSRKFAEYEMDGWTDGGFVIFVAAMAGLGAGWKWRMLGCSHVE
ncbi:hypothetical protein K505DRAFT_336882 [Melanomma pulvis-pyrius CBS 109.77]|uniref:Uncharacterized protein n=1 Tax=Melanomma pulvis-pyrius CBS 109.77 TaxID=1314802 RepID=A0A6A6XDV2_9PLEO|nr:hypothetical protein K505DRAFT_336882 [Melanomma pulvis-pyrius CBS 109.77]